MEVDKVEHEAWFSWLLGVIKVEVKCEYCGILYDDQYTAAVIHNFSRESCTDVSIGD